MTRRILGHAGDELVDAALAAQDVAPQLLRLVGERVVGERRLEDPVLVRDLRLELAGAPARVAGEDAAAGRGRDDLLRLVERREAERLEERHRGVVGVEELAEHEHGLRLHRPADPDLLAVVDDRLELRHRAGDLDGRRAVEHEPRRAVLGVLGHEDDGAPEVRVEQRRRGDEEVSAERLHGSIVAVGR